MSYRPLTGETAAELKRSALIVHATETWHDSVRSRKFDFFEKIAEKAMAEGFDTWLVDTRDPASDRVLREPFIHLHLGQKRLHGTNVWHVLPSYVWGFWYLDRLGVNWNSSLAMRDFDPGDVDGDAAQYFFNGVTGWMLRNNISKFEQRDRVGPDPAPARAVIFLQDIDKYRNPVHHLTSRQMIENTARAVAGKVYVKFHPAQRDAIPGHLTKACAKHDNVEVSDHSIHVLSRCSDVVVTQNSAAGFEALMQRKPVITCAQSDFHHATVVATTPEALRKALRTADAALAGFPYEKYLYWFLGLNMLEPAKPDFAQRAWRVMTRT